MASKKIFFIFPMFLMPDLFLLAEKAEAVFNVLMMNKKGASYPSVPMAVQHQASVSGSNGFRTNVLPNNTTLGNTIVVACVSTSVTDTLTATDNQGNTYTPIVAQSRAGVGMVRLFYTKVTSAGATTITCSSTDVQAISVTAAEYSGVAQVSPVDAFSSNSGNNNQSSATVTTTQPRSIVIKYTQPAVSGYITGFDYANAFARYSTPGGWGFVDTVSPTATTTTIADLLNASQNWVSVIVALKSNGATYTNQKGIYQIGGMINNSTFLNWVLKSVDNGLNWTRVGTVPNGNEDTCLLTHNNAMWVLGGFEGNGVTGIGVSSKVYKSTDGGLTWTNVGNLPAARDTHACVTYNGKMWVIGGTPDDTYGSSVRTVYSSSDGISWTNVGNVPASAGLYHVKATVFNNKIWIAGGVTASNLAVTYVAWSTDGATWSTTGAAALPAFREAGHFFVHNNLMWFMGGYTGGNLQSTVWSCSDPCASWTVNTAAPAIHGFGDTVSINGNMVVVSGNGVYRTYISTNNGSTWTNGSYWPPDNGIYYDWSDAIVGP